MVLAIVMIPVLPVGTFLADLPAITSRYATEGLGGSTGGNPIALGIGLISILALATLDLPQVGWLATIVVVPLNGWYAGAAALPFINPILAIGLALPVVGLPTVTIAIYVAMRVVLRWRPGGRLARAVGPLVEPYRRRDQAALPGGSDAVDRRSLPALPFPWGHSQRADDTRKVFVDGPAPS